MVKGQRPLKRGKQDSSAIYEKKLFWSACLFGSPMKILKGTNMLYDERESSIRPADYCRIA